MQDLIDGRLTPEDAARVEGLIRNDPELAQTATFFRWLNEQLPKLFELGDEPLPERLQQLLDEFSAHEQSAPSADEVDEPAPLPTPTLSSKS